MEAKQNTTAVPTAAGYSLVRVYKHTKPTKNQEERLKTKQNKPFKTQTEPLPPHSIYISIPFFEVSLGF